MKRQKIIQFVIPMEEVKAVLLKYVAAKYPDTKMHVTSQMSSLDAEGSDLVLSVDGVIDDEPAVDGRSTSV